RAREDRAHHLRGRRALHGVHRRGREERHVGAGGGRQGGLAMRKRHVLSVVAILSTLMLTAGIAGTATTALPGTASLEGLVDAPKPFKAAQIYLLNVEKNVLFMVYTAGGRYRAVNLFPGRYEISVKKAGFAADPRPVPVAADATETVSFSLREAPIVPLRQGEFGFTTQRVGEVPPV